MRDTSIYMEPVESSNVSRIGYDEESETVRCEFKNRTGACGAYDYSPVPESVYLEVRSSSSVGQAVRRMLANGGYTATKISNGAAPE